MSHSAYGAIPSISISDISLTESGRKKFGKHKLTISIHEAIGGYIIEISQPVYGKEPELYIIADDAKFESEIGKIITHFQLKAE